MLNLEELKEKINKVGSKLNPRVMVNEFSRKNGKLLVSVKNLETDEISKPLEYFSLLKGHNPWSIKLNLSELKDKINKIGSKLNPKIGFNQFEGRNKWGQLLVSVRDLETNEISKPLQYGSLLKGRNPWLRELSLEKRKEELKEKINKVGSKLNPRIRFNRFEGRNKWGQLLVNVINLETNEVSNPLRYHDILNGSNPFVNKLNLEELKEKINKIGSKLNPRIEFNRFEGRNKWGNLLVSVRNLETNEISKPRGYLDVLKGKNPFPKGISEDQIKKLNKIGSKSNPKIEFNRFEGRNKSGNLLVSIRNLETKAGTY